MSQEPTLLLEQIKKKIKEMHRLQLSLKDENAKLQAALDAKSTALQAEVARVSKLESDLETVKLARAYQDGEEGITKDSRAKINAMVKEIDRCIALLND